MKARNVDAIVFEDDPFLGDTIKGQFGDMGLTCTIHRDVASGENCFRGRRHPPKLVIADLAIRSDGATIISAAASSGGRSSGIEILRESRRRWPSTRLALITGNPSGEAAKWCTENGVIYGVKPITKQQLELWAGTRSAKAFVIHGRNLSHVRKLKRVLKCLNIEPVVLFEQPSKGRTVIEKFEEVAALCDFAVVAFSPDDIGKLAGDVKSKMRARQNVVFELGYFCSALGRKSGRLIVIDFGCTELPSDIAGVIYLDGALSQQALTNQMRIELSK